MLLSQPSYSHICIFAANVFKDLGKELYAYKMISFEYFPTEVINNATNRLGTQERLSLIHI